MDIQPIPKTRQELSVEWFNSILLPHCIQISSVEFLGDAKWQGRGALSTLERVQLKVSNSDQSLCLILKTLPTDANIRKYVIDAGFITREVNMYLKVFSDLDIFLNSRNVNPKYRFRHPKCYYGAEVGSGDTYEMLLVLEDMLSSGYEVWPGGQGEDLDLDRIKTTVHQIALFHAGFIGYGLSKGIKNYLDVYPFLMDSTQDDPNLKYYIDTGFEAVINMLNEGQSSTTPGGLMTRLRDLSAVLPRIIKETFGKEFGFPCIRHHDLHTGNLFFKHGGAEIEAGLIDFQACVNDTPINDVCFFLFSCCNLKYSWTKVDQILEFYYLKLMESLAAMKIEFSYPLEKLQIDYRKSILISLMHITASAPFWFNSESHGKKVLENRLKVALVEAYNKNLLEY